MTDCSHDRVGMTMSSESGTVMPSLAYYLRVLLTYGIIWGLLEVYHLVRTRHTWPAVPSKGEQAPSSPTTAPDEKPTCVMLGPNPPFKPLTRKMQELRSIGNDADAEVLASHTCVPAASRSTEKDLFQGLLRICLAASSDYEKYDYEKFFQQMRTQTQPTKKLREELHRFMHTVLDLLEQNGDHLTSLVQQVDIETLTDFAIDKKWEGHWDSGVDSEEEGDVLAQGKINEEDEEKTEQESEEKNEQESEENEQESEESNVEFKQEIQHENKEEQAKDDTLDENTKDKDKNLGVKNFRAMFQQEGAEGKEKDDASTSDHEEAAEAKVSNNGVVAPM